MWSKRAQALVTSSLKSHKSPVLDESNRSEPLESPVPSDFSPAPSWWDGIFEASDLGQQNLIIANPNALSVKRKLFSCELEQNSSDLIVSVPLKIDSIAINNTSSDNVDHHLAAQPTPVERSDVDISQEKKSPCVPGLTPETEVMFVCSEDKTALSSASPDKTLCDIIPVSLRCEMDPVSEVNTIYMEKKCYPSQLKIHDAKVALNSGLQHTTSSGKLRPARSLKPSCQTQCKRCDAPKLSDNERLGIFNSFWALGNHESQWKFISMSVKCSIPKKKCTAIGSKGEKHVSREYRFEIDGCLKKVCKTMFKNTLAICDSWIDNALSHSCSGSTLPDQRGKRKKKSTDTSQEE